MYQNVFQHHKSNIILNLAFRKKFNLSDTSQFKDYKRLCEVIKIIIIIELILYIVSNHTIALLLYTKNQAKNPIFYTYIFACSFYKFTSRTKHANWQMY